jgi:hypothetical protein
MGKLIFWDYLPIFFNPILCHDVHRCHFQTRDELYAIEKDRDAVAVFDVFADEFQQEFGLCQSALVISKGKCVVEIVYSFLLADLN